jgi:hypothetical protein
MTENLLLNKFHSDEILENLSGAILMSVTRYCRKEKKINVYIEIFFANSQILVT